MTKKISTFLFVLFLPFLLLAQNYTISGYVTDESSGESLISTSIFESKSKKGTVSNLYGFYSLTIPAGKLKLFCSYVGYEQQEHDFVLSNDTIINIKLKAQTTLQELVVVGRQSETGLRAAQISAVDIPIAQIKSIPALMGETDVIKALQLLPGVKAGTEGAAGFYVRGGGPDENLFLLDGVPVYNINHLGGFFSVFNSDAIKNVTLYKGGFPARFGGRLSSVLDIRMKDGNNKKLKADFSIGLIASKINLEGPIFNEKTTFNISARRTYFDLLTIPFQKIYSKTSEDMEKFSVGYYFYDLNLKLSHKFSDKNRLYFSLYMGDDKMSTNIKEKEKSKNFVENITTGMKMNWGNLITAFRWNHLINNKFFMNLTSTYTRYRFDVDSKYLVEKKDADPTENFSHDMSINYISGIKDFTGKVDFDYMLNPNNHLRFGLNYINHTFKHGVSTSKVRNTTEATVIDVDTVIGNKNIYAHETAVYVEDNIKLFDRINANLVLC